MKYTITVLVNSTPHLKSLIEVKAVEEYPANTKKYQKLYGTKKQIDDYLEGYVPFISKKLKKDFKIVWS